MRYADRPNIPDIQSSTRSSNYMENQTDQLTITTLYSTGLRIHLAAAGWEGNSYLLAMGMDVPLDLMDKAESGEDPLSKDEIELLEAKLGFPESYFINLGEINAAGIPESAIKEILTHNDIAKPPLCDFTEADNYLSAMIAFFDSEKRDWPGWEEVINEAFEAFHATPAEKLLILPHWLNEIVPDAKEELEDQIKQKVL